MKLLKQRRRRSGFTLVEILLVVTIIAVLAGLAIPRLAGRGQQARVQAADADIRGGLSNALGLYELDNGRYPERLQDLFEKPASAKTWRGPYLNQIPRDPWGNDYIYRYPGSNNPTGFDLSSAGPDGQEGTSDDIANWGTKGDSAEE